MKRYTLLLMIACLCLLPGCREKETLPLPAKDAPAAAEPIPVSRGGSVNAPEAPEDGEARPVPGEKEPEGGDVYVVSVRDKATEPGMVTGQSLEPFYEDESCIYYFPSLRGGLVIATLSDGREMQVSEALLEGYMTIDELREFGVSFYAEPKTDGAPGYSGKTGRKEKTGA